MTQSFIVDVKENEKGEAFIELPNEVLDGLEWKEGDTIVWKDNHDGSYTLTKKFTQYVLVETVSIFRHRYVVEVPVGKSEWALDTVVMKEATEFSQKHLDETIVSHRNISYEDAIALCDIENDYASPWSEEEKVNAFFTPLKNTEE